MFLQGITSLANIICYYKKKKTTTDVCSLRIGISTSLVLQCFTGQVRARNDSVWYISYEKYASRFDGLIYGMLFIGKLKAELKVQMDSICAKVFV